MRALPEISPSPEQLSIFSRNKPGVEILRGAAGSGKTTTAILRLKSLVKMFISRKERLKLEKPVRVLVLTYNRTLRGYIKALVKEQVKTGSDVTLEISTFAKWAIKLLGEQRQISDDSRKNFWRMKGRNVGLQDDFLLDELEYITGRYLPSDLGNYLTDRRDGRGLSPRVDRDTRSLILENVVTPYNNYRKKNELLDWNDFAVALALHRSPELYDIIITDETQDFSANQIRAILNHLEETHSLTFVIDTAQRIYARGFTWKETGLTIRPENIRQLKINYRNTIEIAQFAQSVIEGIPIDDDATIPDFTKCGTHGNKPIVLRARFGQQIEYVINFIIKKIDLTQESVAFLHAMGGNWFSETRLKLRDAGLKYVEITRKSEWPEGEENIALSTIHSSKGLEFDNVIMIGLEGRFFNSGDGENDERLIKSRRLLAMGIGRAKKNLILGYNPMSASSLMKYFDKSTYTEISI